LNLNTNQVFIVINKYSSRKNEIGSIAEALKVMRKNLLGLVKKEANIADNLAASSQELSASSEEMSASADEVSSSIKKLAQGTVEQNDMLNQTERNMLELDQKIDLITEKAEVIKSEAEAAAVSDEQSNSTIDIVKAAEDLAEMAQNLTVITSRYKSQILNYLIPGQNIFLFPGIF
jgi:methyl-accepting chemotaxis protein